MMTRKPETILLVDDESSIRRMLKQKLTKEGYGCFEAGNAEQALEMLRSHPIELVILDVVMPGKTGFKLLPEIIAVYPDTAVIMATVVSDISTAVQCMKDGASDYLVKPFNLEEVVISVERTLKMRRLKLENRDYQLNLERKVREQTDHIKESFLNFLKALVLALEAKDDYTSDHSRRVSDVAVAIARSMGMPLEDIEKVRVAGLIHDIGKIGVKEAVLNKPGRLTADEYKQVKTHPQIGANILIMVVDDNQILEAVVHHHEHYDGSGYPDGLAGEQIPLGARILAVADAFDAITSSRPYRDAMSIKEATVEIQKGEGTQFDPEIADVLLRYIQTAGLSLKTPGKSKQELSKDG